MMVSLDDVVALRPQLLRDLVLALVKDVDVEPLLTLSISHFMPGDGIELSQVGVLELILVCKIVFT